MSQQRFTPAAGRTGLDRSHQRDAPDHLPVSKGQPEQRGVVSSLGLQTVLLLVAVVQIRYVVATPLELYYERKGELWQKTRHIGGEVLVSRASRRQRKSGRREARLVGRPTQKGSGHQNR
jgi:hypothetical protein